ncbi:MAG: LCP family protein [Candidatus Pacebacteria bacterium]|nr:LCP family protein [Candidatus Paceibacterota bacterium]
MKFKLEKKNWFILGPLLIGLLTAGLFALFYRPESKEPLSPIPPLNLTATPYSVPTEPIPPAPDIYEKGFINTLLIGYGGPGHSGSHLADTLQLIQLNYETKKAFLISIPRDLWVNLAADFQTEHWEKINESFAQGGGSLSKKVVNEVTGLPVDFFAAINFGGFTSLIDRLGGIEVNVPIAFDDPFYPIKGRENDACGLSDEEFGKVLATKNKTEIDRALSCRFDHLYFEAGLQVMDGETALKFVRSRRSSQHGGDFARSQRQQAVLIGLKNKLLGLEIFKNPLDFYRQAISLVQTDINQETIPQFLKLGIDPGEYEIKKINLTDQNVLTASTSPIGQFILIPKSGAGNWQEIQDYLKEEMSS